MKNPQAQAWLTKPDGLATRLRVARGKQSVRDLATKLNWPSSKVSRIETGQQIPTAEEVDRWAAATELDDHTVAELQAQLNEVSSMRSQLRRRKMTEAEGQTPYNELVASTTFLRYMQIAVVPDLLQTPQYARQLLTLVEKVQDDTGTRANLDETVAARMRRQDHLHDSDKRFEILIGESVLRNVPGSMDVMPAQLDRLLLATDLPGVRLGITPQLTPLGWMPGPSSVTIFDNETAYVEGFVEDRQYYGPTVARLHRFLDVMWRDAKEGDEARARILAAKADLSAAASQ